MSQNHGAQFVNAALAPDGGTRALGIFSSRAGPLSLHEVSIEGGPEVATLFLLDVARDSRQRSARWIASYRPGGRAAAPDVDMVAAPDGGVVLALSAAGDVRTRESTVAAPGPSTLVLLGFAPDGKLRWSRVLGSAQVGGVRLAIGGDGSLAVAGDFIQGPIGAGEVYEDRQGTFIAAFAPDGSPRWLRALCAGWPFSPGQGPTAVTVDDEGGVLVAGLAGEVPSWASCTGPRVPTGIYARRYGPGGALRWTFSEPPRVQLYGAILSVASAREVVMAWAHSRLDGTGGVGGSVVVRLDGATGQPHARTALRHSADALFVTGDRVGVLGGFGASEIGVTWIDGEGRSLGSRSYGGFYRLAGRVFFTARDEICSFGMVSDCSPFRPGEELGLAATCAQTSPLYVARIAVDAPPALQIPRR